MTTEALVPAAAEPAVATSGRGEIVLPQVIVAAGPAAVTRCPRRERGRERTIIGRLSRHRRRRRNSPAARARRLATAMALACGALLVAPTRAQAQSSRPLFTPGQTTKTISVPVCNDLPDDSGETMKLHLYPYGAKLRDGEAVGTITNHDRLPRALLARFGRTGEVHVVEPVEERLQAPREPGFQGQLAGRELRPGMEREMALPAGSQAPVGGLSTDAHRDDRGWTDYPVVEEALGLDRPAVRVIQHALEAAGFDPGGADGRLGPRTRVAIRKWQASRGALSTGYLTAADIEALGDAVRPAAAADPLPAAPVANRAAGGVTHPAATSAAAELEGLFWRSVMHSTNPAELEAYLSQFPNGVFRVLAQARLSALPAAPAAARVSDAAPGERRARHRPGQVFRDCDICPEMVVMPGGGPALGRYEVTVGEYRAFASMTRSGAGSDCLTLMDDASWRDPGFPQTDRHPVTCVSWNDAQEYVSWLSRRTGASYRLPTEAEWESGLAGSPLGCVERSFAEGTCAVGSHDSSGAGLWDMAGNLWEWTEDCWEDDCAHRVLRGGSWRSLTRSHHPGARRWNTRGNRVVTYGFRVARTID